jgi:hypothetical protein
MKHRIVHTLQKYLLNPPIKLALTIGLPLPGYALLETKGRKTGKPRRTPVVLETSSGSWQSTGCRLGTSATSSVIRVSG